MRRHGRLWIALGALTVGLLPGAANAVAPSVGTFDVAVGARIKPVATVTGQCTAKIADTDGETISVLVIGTAQTEGAAASTGISCTVLQDPDLNLIFDEGRGGCQGALPLNVGACASIVHGVPLAPFKVCAVATGHLVTGHVVTGYGPSCPAA